MKVISIWQPYASLIAHGMKFFETRTWHPPRNLLGERIGIASTKVIRPEQRAAYSEPEFQHFYSQTGLPPLEDLPHGYLVGTAVLDSVELINEDFRDDITSEELAFGWFEDGRYAWRMRYAMPLPFPVPIRGKQGIFEWGRDDEALVPGAAGQERPADIRRHLHLAQ